MTDAGAAGQAAPAPFYVVFDVDVRDAAGYGEYMAHVLPRIEAAGGKYLARGGPHTVYEGAWSPYRLVLLEFPSREAFEDFYHSPAIRTSTRCATRSAMRGWSASRGCPRQALPPPQRSRPLPGTADLQVRRAAGAVRG